MTLNIDLEEVPFAILEAVKARIMANRRRLQGQQPRPSLRPRPQFTKIGANSKSWRLPKEAVPLGDDTLIVSWKDGEPILSDPSLQQVYRAVIGSTTATTMTVGATIPAVGVTGGNVYGSWQYKTPFANVGKTDFTYETWIQNGLPGAYSVSLFIIVLRLGDEAINNVAPWCDLRVAYVTGSENPLVPNGNYYLIGDPVSGIQDAVSYSPGALLFQPQHLCIMRQGGGFYFYINGVKVAFDDSDQAKEINFVGNVDIEFALYANPYPTLNKLGQIRLTLDEAIYNTAGFTPAPFPFT